MAAQFSTRFIRVQSNLINIEAIQRVQLNSNGSAVLLLNGPRKALQRIEVPAPYGKDIFEFVGQHLAIMEFGEPPRGPKEAKAPNEPKAGKKQKARKEPKASKTKSGKK